MINQYRFCSRTTFVNHTPTPSEIFISITGEENGYIKPTVKGWYAGIFLIFDDVDQKGTDSRIMSQFDADKIVNFLKKYHTTKKKYQLTVHCYAGISRSAAVIKFFEDCFIPAEHRIHDRYEIYNKLVYRNLVDSLHSTHKESEVTGEAPF